MLAIDKPVKVCYYRDNLNLRRFQMTSKYATEQRIHELAWEAGVAAGEAKVPTPMIVGEPTTLFGNDIDYSKKVYRVPSGVCGFAWIVIRPATSRIAKYLKAEGIGRPNYGGGLAVSVSMFGQSYEQKAAFASAYAGVLRENGIKAFAESRLD